MLTKGEALLQSRVKTASTWEEFMVHLNDKNLVLTPWCECTPCEEATKERSATDSKTLSAEETALTGAAKTLCLPFE
jgi:hypothetical protein